MSFLKQINTNNIISDTTRPKRKNNGVWEEDGKQYFFRSEDDVLKDIQEGLFLEAALIHKQQVSGISLRELQKATEHNKIAINEIEIAGALNVYSVKPDAHFIFVLPPSYQIWMDRLHARSDMTDEEMVNRMESAEAELKSALEHDFYKFVINDDLHEAVAEIRLIVEEDGYQEEYEHRAEELARELLKEVQNYLAQQ